MNRLIILLLQVAIHNETTVVYTVSTLLTNLITTLQQLLTNVKDKVEPKDRQGVVYKIKCRDCPTTYVGETGRNLNTRLTEHRRATKNGNNKNNIAEHHLQTDHRIDWDSAECISFSTHYYQQLTLESWFTNLEQTPLNRCQQLPAPYQRLINDKQNKPDKQTNQTNEDQSVFTANNNMT